MSDLIEMSLKKLTYCSRTSFPILILESLEGSYFLPVFVSYPEWGLLTHQSFQNPQLAPALWPLVEELLGTLQVDVREVSVEREDTYFVGRVTIDGLFGQRVLKTRAGEAIAVALRINAPIRARRDQLNKREHGPEPLCEGGDRELLRWLRQARPSDFSP